MQPNLSRKERQVLEMLLQGAEPGIVALNLKISKEAVSTYKTRAKRKVAAAKKFLREMRQFKSVLYPEPNYKGV